MSNEKLVDAIGLIDNKMIYDAKFGRVKRFPYLVQTIAAVLAILIISASVLSGGFYLLGHMSAGIPSPSVLYSYNDDKLLMICKINLSASMEEITENIPLDYDPTELYNQVGSGIFGVEYADNEKVVITTGKGIFIYNYQSYYMMNNFDLDKIDVPGFNQGDAATYIQVDKSGNYAVLSSSQNWGYKDKKVEYLTIDFISGEVEFISEADIPKDFSPFKSEEMKYHPKSDSDKNFNLPYTWPSDVMATYTKPNGDKISFYTNIERDSEGKVIVGNTDLVIVSSDRNYTTQRIFGCMFSEFQK